MCVCACVRACVRVCSPLAYLSSAISQIKQLFFTIAVRLTEHRSALEESVSVRPEDRAFSLLPDDKMGFTRSRTHPSTSSNGGAIGHEELSETSEGQRDRVISGAQAEQPANRSCCKSS